MRIAIGNDHAGFPLKPHVVDHVRRLGHEVIDVGTTDDTPVDFPVMTRRVTDLVARGKVDRGILVCGTGVGAAIAANKVPGIRGAVVHDTYVARQGVEHDDVNVACLGAWVVGVRIAEDVISSFLSARFGTDPDVRRRVEQLHEMELEALADRGADDQGQH
jgi:ribose 5-phosphate isomerase B